MDKGVQRPTLGGVSAELQGCQPGQGRMGVGTSECGQGSVLKRRERGKEGKYAQVCTQVGMQGRCVGSRRCWCKLGLERQRWGREGIALGPQ